MSFDTFYGAHPWEGVTTNQREWYDPNLRAIYNNQAIWGNYVNHQFNLAGAGSPRTTKMTITSLIPAHSNNDPITNRQLWMPSSSVDTFAREITFQRYGGKMALHKYDDMITYWLNEGKPGLANIINQALGGMMVGVLDKLQRNAFLSSPYKMYAGAATSFNDIAVTDVVNTEVLEDARIGMSLRNVPFATNPQAAQFLGAKGICVTTPGVIADIMTEASASAGAHNQFINTMQYADPTRILNGEIGTYKGWRFVETPSAILFNCGAITAQTAVSAPIAAGDGASAALVDGVNIVAQPGATNTITVADATGFAVNDMVSIHVDRTADFGVTNGADYRDGKFMVRRIEAVTGGLGGTLSFDMPLTEDYDVDLGAGVYAYVTKGAHIHASVFIGGMDGVVGGVGAPPRVYTPRPVDDFDSMYRISWDAYLGYQIFEPKSIEVVFSSGKYRNKNSRS